MIAVVLTVCIVMAGSQPCPTGQTACDMAGMTETGGMDTVPGDGAICVLACGVPLQETMAAVGTFIGKVSIVSVSLMAPSASIDIEPDVPPPRTLA